MKHVPLLYGIKLKYILKLCGRKNASSQIWSSPTFLSLLLWTSLWTRQTTVCDCVRGNDRKLIKSAPQKYIIFSTQYLVFFIFFFRFLRGSSHEAGWLCWPATIVFSSQPKLASLPNGLYYKTFAFYFLGRPPVTLCAPLPPIAVIQGGRSKDPLFACGVLVFGVRVLSFSFIIKKLEKNGTERQRRTAKKNKTREEKWYIVI